MSLKQKFKEYDKLPTLEKSQKIQEIADIETNFNYHEKDDILKDLYDEINELKEELDKGNNKQRIFEELGDILFVLGNLANKYKINSQMALEYSIKEYTRRMIYCEENYNGKLGLKNEPKETMINLWKQAKEKH